MVEQYSIGLAGFGLLFGGPVAVGVEAVTPVVAVDDSGGTEGFDDISCTLASLKYLKIK